MTDRPSNCMKYCNIETMAKALSAETWGETAQQLTGESWGSKDRLLALAKLIVAICGTIASPSLQILSMLSLTPKVRSSESRARAYSSRAFPVKAVFVPVRAALEEN